MRSRDCKPWIRFVLETCAREYEYAYHIFLDFIIPFSKKFLFSEGMILDECININFAFFFLFRLDLKGKGWKLFDYTRCFYSLFFSFFLYSFFTRDNKRKEGLPL